VSDGQIESVIPHLVDGVFILQYANDTILFYETFHQKTRNLKLSLLVRAIIGSEDDFPSD
jgi:hypothetical protein